MFNQVCLEGKGQFSNFQSFGVFQPRCLFSFFRRVFPSKTLGQKKTTQKRCGVWATSNGKVANFGVSIFLSKNRGWIKSTPHFFQTTHHKNIQKSVYLMLPHIPIPTSTLTLTPLGWLYPKWLLLQVQVPRHWAAKELCEHGAPNWNVTNHLVMEDLNQLSWHVSGQFSINP